MEAAPETPIRRLKNRQPIRRLHPPGRREGRRAHWDKRSRRNCGEA